jgi:hypothetical protein
MAPEGPRLSLAPNSIRDSLRRLLQWLAENFVTGPGRSDPRLNLALDTRGVLIAICTACRVRPCKAIGSQRRSCPPR